MAPLPPLFTLPIAPSGNITCTVHAPQIYLLTWTSPPDNRITPAFCNALLLALDIIEHRHPTGVVVTTSGIPKFYSNGLDYQSAIRDPQFFPDTLYPLWRRFLTTGLPDLANPCKTADDGIAAPSEPHSYPMPTIALIPGHAFAAGLMTAMMHDYRFANPHKGYLCLNELDFGAPLTPPMASIFRQKLPSPHTYRQMVLEAKRFKGLEALRDGVVDGLAGGLEDVRKFVEEYGLSGRGRTGVYGRLKGEMWRETVGDLDSQEDAMERLHQREEADARRKDEGLRRVEAWEKSGRAVAKL